MSETRPTYGTFQLDTPNDEEKLRFVLSVLPLDVLHRLATMVQAVKDVGFGDVTVKIQAGRIFVLTITKSERVEEPCHEQSLS